MAAQENLDLLVRVRVLVPQLYQLLMLYNIGRVAELADAQDLGSCSSEWGFKSPLAHGMVPA